MRRVWTNSTKRTEDGTGLVLYEYRAHSPALGRWLSRDPIEEQGRANLFAFCVNQAVGTTDYLGLQFAPPGWPRAGPGSPPFPPPQPPLPQPPQTHDPEEFALWRRVVDGSDKKFLERLCTRVISTCSGFRTHVQHYKSAQEPCPGPPHLWGRRFSGREVTTPEKHCNRLVCGPCNNNGTALKHGSGAGKPGTSASDEEIMDCIQMENLIGGTTFQHTCVVPARGRRCGIVASHVSDVHTSCSLCWVLLSLPW
ncbi:RHS repeat-associated core domain-containing protein [Limisphaera ngatamarikiensis]|uniref:RHS repeat-associated core domain-containing protein n=1 Tax=Limisphaera ngatamarikiensis TaxID=1324935 RepID=UPI001980861E